MIVSLDTYEVFRLMEPWVRQVLIPLLPDNVRVVLCGREEPVTAWLLTPGWQGLFKAIRLDSLDQRSALKVLAHAGVPPDEARHLEGICHGHPLALTLAASMQANRAGGISKLAVGQRVIEEFARVYMGDIPRHTRRILEAVSVVRRVTMPILAAILPDLSSQDSYERIRTLPFVQADKDGLQIHDAVREAVAATLCAGNPQEYREYRRAAYRQIMLELHAAVPADLWRCTADLLYLLEHPVIREAFFPTGAQAFVVEPAQAQDQPRILEIIDRHETCEMSCEMAKWLMRAPETFAVARDSGGIVAGFYCAFEASQVPVQFLREDPVTCRWLEDLQQQPLPRQQRAFFLRRWLSADSGEAPSAVQAACFVDLKRKYLELRPSLRRVYLTLRELTPYAAVLQTLDFQVLLLGNPRGNTDGYSTAMPDFGPSSVDGWLTRLVAAELGVSDHELLDCAARELVLEGRRVSLPKLEFGVMEYLQRNAGEAVSRIDLLENVWEQKYNGGSNVVDVVIRALRKKLADNASAIESVHGIGYKLRKEVTRPAC